MIHLVIDLETTGIDPQIDAIVEMAGVWREGDFDEKNSMKAYAALCNPGRTIPPEAKSVHHIVEKMVSGAPDPLTVWANLITAYGEFAPSDGSPTLVAHNAKFDRGFMNKLLPELEGYPFWVCTYKCAMVMYPDAPSHSNQGLRYWLELEPEIPDNLYPHRALYDAIVTEAILQEMLKDKPLEELVEISSKPILLTKVRFGKWKGSQWNHVPRDYLSWIVRQGDMDEDVLFTARHYLENGR